MTWTEFQNADSNHVCQDRVHRKALKNTVVTKNQVPRRHGISWATTSFSRRTLLHAVNGFYKWKLSYRQVNMLCGHHCYKVQTVRSPHCHTLVKTILDTFKSGIAYSLSTETLHIFHTIHYNGSTEDVCKGKYMELFETGPWLTGKRKKASPVLFPLSLLKTEFKQLGLTCFIFFPARIKPVSSSTVSTCATHRPFNTAK